MLAVRAHAIILPLILASSLIASATDHPAVSQVAQLTASDIQPDWHFGIGVAVGDNTIAVLANTGAIYIFEKPVNGWQNMTQTAELSDPNTACFYNGLAISSNGATIVVGLQSCADEYGWIDVYVRPSGGWQNMQPTATLTVPIEADDHSFLGTFTSLSADGKTIVSNGYNNRTKGSYLAVYEEPATGWVSTTATATIVTPGGFDTVANNGEFVAEISPVAGTNVFQRGPGGAQFLATLSDSIGDGLCCGLAMNVNTIVVGVPGANNSIGGADVFVEASSGWTNATQTAQLTTTGLPANSAMGTTLAVSGKAILVGGTYTHAAYLYLEPGEGWQSTSTPAATLVSTDPYQVSFGYPVAMYGTTIAIADLNEGQNNLGYGAVYVFLAQ